MRKSRDFTIPSLDEQIVMAVGLSISPILSRGPGSKKSYSEISMGAPCISEFFARGCSPVIPPLCKGRQSGVESLKYLEAWMFSPTAFSRRSYLPSTIALCVPPSATFSFKGGGLKNDQPRFSPMLLSEEKKRGQRSTVAFGSLLHHCKQGIGLWIAHVAPYHNIDRFSWGFIIGCI